MATPVVTAHDAKGRQFFLWRGMTHRIAVVPEADSAAAYGPPPARPRRSPASRIGGIATSPPSERPRRPRPRRRNLPHLPEPIGARRPPSTAYAALRLKNTKVEERGNPFKSRILFGAQNLAAAVSCGWLGNKVLPVIHAAQPDGAAGQIVAVLGAEVDAMGQ